MQYNHSHSSETCICSPPPETLCIAWSGAEYSRHFLDKQCLPKVIVSEVDSKISSSSRAKNLSNWAALCNKRRSSSTTRHMVSNRTHWLNPSWGVVPCLHRNPLTSLATGSYNREWTRYYQWLRYNHCAYFMIVNSNLKLMIAVSARKVLK